MNTINVFVDTELNKEKNPDINKHRVTILEIGKIIAKKSGSNSSAKSAIKNIIDILNRTQKENMPIKLSYAKMAAKLACSVVYTKCNTAGNTNSKSNKPNQTAGYLLITTSRTRWRLFDYGCTIVYHIWCINDQGNATTNSARTYRIYNRMHYVYNKHNLTK